MYACPEWFRMRWSKVNWIFSCFCRFSLERQSWDQLLLRYQEEAEEILSRLDLWQEIGRFYLVTFDLISVLLAQTEWWIQSYRPVNSSNVCRVHMNSVTENGEWGGWEGRVVTVFSQRTELPLFCALGCCSTFWGRQACLCPVPGNLGLGQEQYQRTSVSTWPLSCDCGREPQPGPSWRHRGERGDGSGSTGERRSLGLEGIIKWESARFWFHFTVQTSDFKFFSLKQNLS